MKGNQKKTLIDKKKLTFFAMFSKLGLLMREKQRRKTSAPL